MRRFSPASSSFVLASLRALQLDPDSSLARARTQERLPPATTKTDSATPETALTSNVLCGSTTSVGGLRRVRRIRSFWFGFHLDWSGLVRLLGFDRRIGRTPRRTCIPVQELGGRRVVPDPCFEDVWNLDLRSSCGRPPAGPVSW